MYSPVENITPTADHTCLLTKNIFYIKWRKAHHVDIKKNTNPHVGKYYINLKVDSFLCFKTKHLDVNRGIKTRYVDINIPRTFPKGKYHINITIYFSPFAKEKKGWRRRAMLTSTLNMYFPFSVQKCINIKMYYCLDSGIPFYYVGERHTMLT